MSNDIQLNDPADLNTFATNVRKIVSYITAHQKDAEAKVGLPPVKYGQGSTMTQVPQDLSGLMQASMTEIGGNVQTLIDKLNLIADSADDIAKNYKTANDLDQMGINIINSELGVPAGE